MRERKRTPAATDDTPASTDAKDSPLSLSRLRKAFATMLGEQPADEESPRGRVSPTLDPDSRAATGPRGCEINPRSVVEAMLFVGQPDNRALSAREVAAAMRGVSPSEIDTAVAELNAMYDRDEAPYRIETSPGGYRLALREEFERMRDKFHGPIREAKLSPAALEVLSVLAYNQPATADELAEVRGAPCGATLATLVRHRLARIERPSEAPSRPIYSTTDRFLKLFGLESLAALPQSEELEKI